MGSTERIKNVAARVAKWHDAGHQIVVVPSAMSGETNRLIALAKEIMPQPDPRELDMIASTGEQVSVGLLAMALLAIGKDAVSYTGWQAGIRTDSAFTKARIQSIDDTRVRGDLESGKIVIITGFQDTDVDGVYTTDPRVVTEARRLSKITFEEMLELASLGSKVLQTRSVEFAGNYQVPTRVLSSLTDPLMDLAEEASSGTLISFEEESNMEQAVISGIAFNRDEAKITVLGVPDKPGVAFHILGPIADANIEVDMIIQNQSVDGKTDFTFTVSRNDYVKAMNVLEGEKQSLGAASVSGDAKVSKVSAVGVGMRSHVGVASQMFRTLSEEGINILMISTSEIKISVLIDEKYMELAVRALHKAFNLEQA